MLRTCAGHEYVRDVNKNYGRTHKLLRYAWQKRRWEPATAAAAASPERPGTWKRLMALSLGTIAALVSQRTRFTWPLPCLELRDWAGNEGVACMCGGGQSPR